MLLRMILGVVSLAASATIAAAQSAPSVVYPLPTPVYVSGTANATITVAFGVAPASGSTVSCSLTLLSSDDRAPSDTKAKSAVVSGTTAICPVSVRYRWRLGAASGSYMTIVYSVSGPEQSSSGTINTIPMPADGTVLNMAFTVNQ